MKFTSPAGHINLRETADPETGLKPKRHCLVSGSSVAVPGKGTGKMKKRSFFRAKTEKWSHLSFVGERNQQHPED